MLTIRRVPTVMSMNQELEHAGCGKGCLGMCCIPGAKLPMYHFGRVPCDGLKKAQLMKTQCALQESVPDVDDDGSPWAVTNSENTFLELLLAQWEDRMSRGLFRYDVTSCETKVLPGKHGFIAQLNEGRHLKKRATEFRIDQVLQPFDAKKFNFTKLAQDEVLFCFEEDENGKSEYFEQAQICDSPNVIAINVSPIDYGHVLLIPRVLDHIPQRIDEDTFLLALHMAVEADNSYFRVGYNSLGAFATINHLHFQAYYLAAPFPVERAATVRIPALLRRRKRTVKISELSNYPVRGLVFELGESLEDLANIVANCCMELQARNLPFNILISDAGARVFLFPQCFAERQARGEVDQEILDVQVNPAAWEVSGHIVLKRKEDYEAASEEAYAWRLLAEVSLSEDAFEEVKMICMRIAEGCDGFTLPPSMCSPVLRIAQADDSAGVMLKDSELGTSKKWSGNVKQQSSEDYVVLECD